MSDSLNVPSRKISEDVHSIGKNIFLDSSSPMRRSAMEKGSLQAETSAKLNRSFMSGKIRLQNSRPTSMISNVSVIDENKEMETKPTEQLSVPEKKNKISTSTIASDQSTDLNRKVEYSSEKFERQSSIQKHPIYNAPQRNDNSRDPYGNKINLQSGIANQAYVPTSQMSINGGSVASLPVYREQYCFYSRWSRLERILLLIIFILCFIIACLVSLVGYLANQGELKRCDETPGLLRFINYCKQDLM